MDHANGYGALGAVAMESAVSLYGRLFWWPACLTPPFVLLVEMYTARTAQSADTALGAAFIEVPLFLLVFFAGAVLVVLAAISRVLTKREQSFLSTLGISPAAMLLLFGYYQSQMGWPKIGLSPRAVVGSVALTALWVILAVWFRRAAWPLRTPPGLPRADHAPQLARMIVEFDETTLLQKLSGLTPDRRTAFAALCSERQVPLYREFHTRSGRGNPGVLEEAIDITWSSVRDPQADMVRQRMISLESLELNMDDPDCDEWLEYASDAVASVSATLRTMIDQDPEVATWPARAGYRIVDAHVLANSLAARGIDGGDIDPEEDKQIVREVLRSEVVQRELRQQLEDLALASRFGDATSEPVIAQERKKRLQTGMLSPG